MIRTLQVILLFYTYRHRRDFTKVNFPVKQVKNYMKFPFGKIFIFSF